MTTTSWGPTKESSWTCFKRKLTSSPWLSQVCNFGIFNGWTLGNGKYRRQPRTIRRTEWTYSGNFGDLNWRITAWATYSLFPKVALVDWTTWKLKNWRRRKQVFNNFPGFLIISLQSFKEHLESHDFGSSKINIFYKVRKCAQEMIVIGFWWNWAVNKEIENNWEWSLMISVKSFTKHWKRIQTTAKSWKSTSSNSKINTVLKWWPSPKVRWEKYSQSLWRKSGCITTLRTGSSEENNVEIKKKVFCKYLVSFTQELYAGEIQSLINREKVLSIELL